MNISRKHVEDTFKEYTDRYDSTDTKIKLKIDHTYRVAKISEEIATSLRLSREDIELAWLIGMLHDIGRFEQVRRYNTFSDADSIDHAIFGAQLLFEENLLDDYLGQEVRISPDEDTKDRLDTLKIAIYNHSAYKIAQGLTDRQVMFCNIIRDADKIDILRVNSVLPLEEIYNVSTKELKEAQVTKEVLDAFYEEHAVLRKLKKAPVDHVVGHISLVYELVYEKSYEILSDQGYIYKLMGFTSDNDKTNEVFSEIRAHMNEFLSKKTGRLDK